MCTYRYRVTKYDKTITYAITQFSVSTMFTTYEYSSSSHLVHFLCAFLFIKSFISQL